MNTRSIFFAAVAAVAMTSVATGALAAGSVSTTASASVTILAPMTITKTQDMAFGQIVRPTNASVNTVILNTTGVVSLTGAGDGSIVSSPTTAAKFDLTALPGTTYTTSQVLTFSTTGLTSVAASAPTVKTGTLGTIPPAGVQEIRYGGQFDMTNVTPVQAYTGTLTVTINYP